MSIVDDYEAIAEALKAKEKSPIVTDPNPPEYVEPADPNFYPNGYLEAFKAYANAANSMPYQSPGLGRSPSELNDWCRQKLANGRFHHFNLPHLREKFS